MFYKYYHWAFHTDFYHICLLQLTWALHATLRWSWLSVSKWFHVERMRWKLRRFPRRRWHVKRWNPGNKVCFQNCKIKFWNLERILVCSVFLVVSLWGAIDFSSNTGIRPFWEWLSYYMYKHRRLAWQIVVLVYQWLPKFTVFQP